jgi:predicted small metal-binding protein
VKWYTCGMRVMDCDCGKTLQAGNEDDLVAQVRAHTDEEHQDLGLSDEQVRQMVADRSYEASDS